jgi:8-oxo-dGTP pyrophosphatase MutT (NUDIX family)
MTDDHKILYEDRYFRVIGGNEDSRFISSARAALCVPLTPDNDVILISEFSPAFGKRILTLPSGSVDKDEEPHVAANRELQEETGYKARQMDFLGRLYPWGKYLDVTIDIFLGRSLVRSARKGDEGETIPQGRVAVSRFEELIHQGRLQDSTVIAALYLTQDFLAREMG